MIKKERGFKKGVSGNPAGRPKGSVNKVTAVLRDVISDFVQDKFSKIEEVYEPLEAKDKAKFLVDLTKYVLPALSAVTADVKGEVTSINITYGNKEG